MSQTQPAPEANRIRIKLDWLMDCEIKRTDLNLESDVSRTIPMFPDWARRLSFPPFILCFLCLMVSQSRIEVSCGLISKIYKRLEEERNLLPPVLAGFASSLALTVTCLFWVGCCSCTHFSRHTSQGGNPSHVQGPSVVASENPNAVHWHVRKEVARGKAQQQRTLRTQS